VAEVEEAAVEWELEVLEYRWSLEEQSVLLGQVAAGLKELSRAVS
jgi:hypothetical protein